MTFKNKHILISHRFFMTKPLFMPFVFNTLCTKNVFVQHKIIFTPVSVKKSKANVVFLFYCTAPAVSNSAPQMKYMGITFFSAALPPVVHRVLMMKFHLQHQLIFVHSKHYTIQNRREINLAGCDLGHDL